METLVALIERSMHGVDGVSVKSPMRVPDKDTGEMREHDVVIEFKHHHHNLIVALECRDRTSRVGSPAVEAFWAKCLKTGINSGVIVSSSGFSAPALAKAAGYNIRCLSLSDAECFDWCECGGIWFVQPEILSGELECVANEPIAAPYKIYTADGVEFTSEHAGRVAVSELSKHIPAGTVGGPHHQAITFGPQPGYIIDRDGKRQDISGAVLFITYQINRRFLDFQYYRYADESAAAEIGGAASVQFPLGESNARLILVKQPDQGIAVALSHHRHDD